MVEDKNILKNENMTILIFDHAFYKFDKIFLCTGV